MWRFFIGEGNRQLDLFNHGRGSGGNIPLFGSKYSIGLLQDGHGIITFLDLRNNFLVLGRSIFSLHFGQIA